MSGEAFSGKGALKRGFTLLEVLMAIAILGLGLSVLLGAQTGLFANATRTEHISIATGLARCRMSEVELDLLQKGYPLVESEGEGPCCMGESSEGFTCAWKVKRIVMPEMGFGDGGIEGGLADQEMSIDGGLNLGTTGLGASSGGTPGPLGLLMQLEATKGQNLGTKPDIGSLATQLQGSMGGVDGLASMVLGMVYPTLKPMLEASIRKVTVSVKWHEGSRERTLDLTQYVTDPKQGNIDQDGGVGMLDGGFGALPGMMGMDPSSGTGLGTGTGTGTGTGLGTGTGTTPTLGGTQ